MKSRVKVCGATAFVKPFSSTFPKFRPTVRRSAFPWRIPCSERLPLQPSAASVWRPVATQKIYVVDDMPDLTDLYTTLLESAGFAVRAFNDRSEALTALVEDKTKPDLLITDYLGHSMPTDCFINHCRLINRSLRILIVSGVDRPEARECHGISGRFIRKPFVVHEFQQEVISVLMPQ